MRRLIVVLALAGLLGCSASNGTDGPKPTYEWNADLPQSAKLAGRAVEEEESGPWVVRKTGGGSSDRHRGLASGGAPAAKAMDLAESEERYDAGADMPATGAAAPMESKTKSMPEPVADPAADPVDSREVDRRAQGRAPLKAGTTDDNADYEAFLAFLATWGDREDTAETFDLLDVADRRYVRVETSDGRPLPGARVQVADVAADRVVLAGTTYGDGRVPFYPHLQRADNVLAGDRPRDRYVVEVSYGDHHVRRGWDGRADLTIRTTLLPAVEDPVRLDVVILLDTTGSMGDEIGRIKDSLLSVTQKLRSLEREFDLRYGAVLYRDVGDVYVTMAHPFTSDIQAFDAALQAVGAGGGNDYPESVNQGLAEAVGRMDWRERAAKVVFLIGDAPPHMDYAGDVTYGQSLKAALAKGIRIHSVAASGLESSALGSLVFRQIAQFTRGKFIFIEYGGDVAASGAAHGVDGAKKSNNLDDILFAQLREEVAKYGRD